MRVFFVACLLVISSYQIKAGDESPFSRSRWARTAAAMTHTDQHLPPTPTVSTAVPIPIPTMGKPPRHQKSQQISSSWHEDHRLPKLGGLEMQARSLSPASHFLNRDDFVSEDESAKTPRSESQTSSSTPSSLERPQRSSSLTRALAYMAQKQSPFGSRISY